ncbi:Maf family protein [Mycolicibacterium sediminis]|uniref:Nucleoside triphosphate pyrophosphatase n=1 Tax=Mycolicibacterium sediminis TaxID=1286180 RepID=A0A7I7QQJ0_9MYCO|nr:nucleoside triphosphate pyrophosphatase [Mycolicibacterium sediminis]BBY28611.1 Maf-like protein [Mycolicibacterium sediminis]
MTRLVLGSASAGRLGVLRRAGVEPLVVVSNVDEDAVAAGLPDGVSPAELVCALAVAKAEAVTGSLPVGLTEDCIVVGCDSMLSLDGRMHGKPGTADVARRQWTSMAGRDGVLHTGHAVLRIVGGVVADRAIECGDTTIHFGRPTDAELDAYVASGEPLGVAGAFTLDGRSGWFIDGIVGDPSNVIGLSLPLLRRLLHRVGSSLADVVDDPT